jgi:phospholipase/carboxylesterase
MQKRYSLFPSNSVLPSGVFHEHIAFDLSGAARAAAAGRPAWLLVLMHGVGSNEQDLFGLVPYVPPQFHVLSLRAPFAMGMGAYAWFQFTVDADGTRHINVPQEQQARILLQQTVEQAAQQLDIPPERVVLGGFSQGGIMSLSQLLTQPQTLRAALVWHSRLLPEIASLHAPAAASRASRPGSATALMTM